MPITRWLPARNTTRPPDARTRSWRREARGWGWEGGVQAGPLKGERGGKVGSLLGHAACPHTRGAAVGAGAPRAPAHRLVLAAGLVVARQRDRAALAAQHGARVAAVREVHVPRADNGHERGRADCVAGVKRGRQRVGQQAPGREG
jgi:hypothetical protein